MPIYEYRCPHCGEVQEALIPPGGREESIHCGQCGSLRMERILSAHTAPLAFARPKGQTCCGRQERCDTPPCSSGESCRKP